MSFISFTYWYTEHAACCHGRMSVYYWLIIFYIKHMAWPQKFISCCCKGIIFHRNTQHWVSLHFVCNSYCIWVWFVSVLFHYYFKLSGYLNVWSCTELFAVWVYKFNISPFFMTFSPNCSKDFNGIYRVKHNWLILRMKITERSVNTSVYNEDDRTYYSALYNRAPYQ